MINTIVNTSKHIHILINTNIPVHIRHGLYLVWCFDLSDSQTQRASPHHSPAGTGSVEGRCSYHEETADRANHQIDSLGWIENSGKSSSVLVQAV